MAKRSPVRVWSEYLLVQLLRLMFLSFPINLNLQSARIIGRLWAALRPGDLRKAANHVRMAYGSTLSPEQIHRLALTSMQNFAMTGIELMQSPRLISRWTWSKYVSFHNIEPFLELALACKPAILVTGHFGNFELLGQIIACFLGKFTGVMRQLDNPLLNDYMVRTRRHTGLELIFKKGAMQSAEAVLRDQQLLGFLPDQDAGRKGVFVDFFGTKASTVKSVALLAVDHDVPVVVGYCRRLGNRFQHELGVERIIDPSEWHDRDDAVQWLTQAYMAAIESYVRRCPEQYLWTHRRWKTRPRGEGPLPPAAAVDPAPAAPRAN